MGTGMILRQCSCTTGVNFSFIAVVAFRYFMILDVLNLGY